MNAMLLFPSIAAGFNLIPCKMRQKSGGIQLDIF